MTIIRWTPLRELVDTRRQMESLLDLATRDFSPLALWESPRLVPPIDVQSKGDDLVVSLEIAGLDVNRDVDISIKDDMLCISGERRAKDERQEGEYHIREMSYGRFSRSFPLPRGVRAEDVEAEYQNGLLEITVKGGARHEHGRQHVPIHAGADTSSIESKSAASVSSAGEDIDSVSRDVYLQSEQTADNWRDWIL